MMQDGYDLHEPFLLEQPIPDVVAEGIRAEMAQPETADWWLMRVPLDPVQYRFDRVQATFRLMGACSS